MPARRADVTLPAQPESVPAGRHFLNLHLREWGLDAATDAAGLAASELLTNAVLHARTPVRMTVVAEDHLVVSVHDSGDDWSAGRRRAVVSAMALPDEYSEGGRGLTLVAALSDDWGIDADGTGTTVWFQVALT